MTQNNLTDLTDTSTQPTNVAVEPADHKTETVTDAPLEASPKKPVKVKLTGRMLNFTRLHITGDDLEQIKTELDKKFANQPNSKLLVVLSCEEKLDLAELLNYLWGLNLQPIGIVTGQMDEQAHEQRLAIFPADGKRIDVLTEDKKATKAPTPTPAKSEPTAETTEKSESNSDSNPDSNSDTNKDKNATTDTHENLQETLLAKENNDPEPASTYTSSLPQTSHMEGDLVYSTMLRSGQSINHVGGDLVLTQGINAGAEAITDYSLHVYGKAEGRLVAGATGDENAKIFCLRFNPSLVSVAGTFCLRENIPSEFLDKAVQVSYESDKGLVFNLMNI